MQNFREIGPVVFEKNGNEQTDKEKYNIDNGHTNYFSVNGCSNHYTIDFKP